MPTSTDYNAVLWATRKKLYDEIVLEAPLFSRIKSKTRKDVAKGKDDRWYTEWLVNVKIASATRTVPEGNTMPTARPSLVLPAKLGLKTVACPVSITGELDALGRITGDTTVLDNELVRVKEDFAFYLEHVLWGDGSGVISTVKTDAGEANNVFIASSLRFLREGMLFDVHNLATGAKVLDSREITAINHATKEVTFSGYAASLTAGNGICVEDMYGIEFPGLLALINDNAVIGASNYANWFVTKGVQTYANIDRALYPAYRPVVLRGATPGTPETFTEGKLTLAVAQAKVRNKPTKTIRTIYADGGVAYTIAKACPQNVYVTNLHKEAGIQLPITFNNMLDNNRIEVVVMNSAPPHTALMVSEDDLEVRWTGEPDWVVENGKILQWQGNMPGGTNASRGTYMALLALIGHNPSRHVVITDIAYHADIAAVYPL